MRIARTYAPDRTAPPPPGVVRPFRFPPYARARLANGLEVLAARRSPAPLVGLELIFPAGARHAAVDRAGLAAMTALLLERGTRSRGALEIAAAIERLGGLLAVGAGWDVAHVSVELESRHAAAGIDLVAEVATTPSFPDEEIERLRGQRQGELMRLQSDPRFLVQERFLATLYGAVSPYGLPRIGTAESLAALDRADVEAFYRARYPLAGAVAVAVGDLDPERFVHDLEDRFGSDPAGARPADGPAIAPPPLPGVVVHVVDRPGAAQTELLIGHVGVPRSHPDFLALAVLNSILGGKFTSRINLNLRERHGYTYGASSAFDGRQGPGPFSVGTAVANAAVGHAAAEVLAEMARIRDEPVGADELEDSRNYLLGTFPFTLQTISGVGRRLANLAVYGLPADYYERYPEAVAAVDGARVAEVARRHLHPESVAVVAVGPAAELVPQFAGWESIEVHRLDGGTADGGTPSPTPDRR